MSNRRDQTIVIGGGLIGAMCAWYLVKSGRSVTIVDRNSFGSGCSHGNCGFVCPSHVLPLAAPGAIGQTVKALFRRNSPLSIKLRWSPSLWYWLWRFARRCNTLDMMRAARGRHALLQSSLSLYRELFETETIDCEWERRGLLFVYLHPHEFEKYRSTATMLRDQFGVTATAYESDALVQLEPALKPGLGGAWHFEEDCHLRPDKFLSELRGILEAKNVRFVEHSDVKGLICEQDQVQAVRTSTRDLTGETFVVATGALTPFLNRHLGCRIPIEPGKGYSLTMPRPDACPRIPMIFEEHRVAVTPMQTGYRIGSTMEFAGYDTQISRKRLDLLREGTRPYLHQPYCDPVQEEWYGWRPMTWDGLPFLDRSPVWSNVWIAAGHNMLGLSMAPGTGKLITEMINGDKPHLDPQPYSLARMSLKV